VIHNLQMLLPESPAALDESLRYWARARREVIPAQHLKGSLVAHEDGAVAVVADGLNRLGISTPEARRAWAAGVDFVLCTCGNPLNIPLSGEALALTLGDVARRIAGVQLTDPADLDSPPPVGPGGPAAAGHGNVKPGPVADPILHREDPAGPGPGEHRPPGA
jgi:hypothetical protein